MPHRSSLPQPSFRRRWPEHVVRQTWQEHLLCLPTLLSLVVWPVLIVYPARADTGVSDGRVSLPDGPGSVGGAGENLSVSGNMGALSHVVPLELPQGFAGAKPSLALSYNSLSGSGEVGLGWDLTVPFIERFTVRGVPRYTENGLRLRIF